MQAEGHRVTAQKSASSSAAISLLCGPGNPRVGHLRQKYTLIAPLELKYGICSGIYSLPPSGSINMEYFETKVHLA